MVFDGFKRIEPNSRSLICFHPHGILTIGWALTNTDPVLLHAKIKWLATEALLMLPFISDFLSWNGAPVALSFSSRETRRLESQIDPTRVARHSD